MDADKLREKQQGYRRETVERIIAMMREGGLNWTRDWSKHGCMAPVNGKTARAYHGANRLYLMGLYPDARWFTFKQAKLLGFHPRKGEHSQPVEKWTDAVGYQRADGTWTKKGDPDGHPVSFLRLQAIYHVFNACQLEDAEGNPYPDLGQEVKMTVPESSLWGVADDLRSSSRCPVRETQEAQAYYSPAGDFIHMPERKRFATCEGYITTLAHEMAHSTAVPLSRKGTGHRFGSKPYAFEELVAELSSMFTCLDLGVESADLEHDENVANSAAYIDSWASELSRTPDLIFRAASYAEKATDYIVARYRDLQAQSARNAA